MRKAKAERLTLQKSDNASGYLGVRRCSSRRRLKKPYEATETRGGKTVCLGYFATADEAALFRAGLVKWGGVDTVFAYFNMQKSKKDPCPGPGPK